MINKLSKRPIVLLLVCCVPTVLATAGVAYYLGVDPVVSVAQTVAVDVAAYGQPAAPPVVRRDVARSMLPGAASTDSAGLVAHVTYAGDVATLPASAAVFVFARRADIPMPLAVERYQPAELPVEVVFFAPDESPTPLLITARLSRGGGVRLEEGDSEASSEPMLPGPKETRVELRIPSL
jgi:hypothetical protein